MERVNASGNSLWEWRRNPTGRTNQELVELSRLLSSVTLDISKQDAWRWCFSSSGTFSVKKLTRMVEDKMFTAPINTQSTLRNHLVPRKVELFVWRALKKRLPVRIELDKRASCCFFRVCFACFLFVLFVTGSVAYVGLVLYA
ncbi:uncharacterized protein [Rutidosis leptorrhynchoides]|uniref:uncharacterized protein n=1 Tax=Rutidosis leptorrhynchoides TaxID=125765 RepID=UPI003A9A4D0E